LGNLLTFYLSNSIQKDIFLSLFILDAGKYFVDNTLSELRLLTLLRLLLIPHPAVKYRLHLRGDGDFLLLHESLGFQLGGLLENWKDGIRPSAFEKVEGDVTFERAKRPSVWDTTSFIWPTESIRSLTACVCSARAPSSTFLIREMWPSTHSRYGSRMI